ncbi:unnamed protein product [Clonostachys rhizophaga]|uniref:Manganese/iron superoxide dismutase C-terminal domain-containing protein n=1 Tax=Clonostachys rhizophaga TaxID=160324 RepID=A0A9N9V1Q7_9HYPO|nr:unnamed protein product [Clonostachys rhizophaga]
MLRPRLRVPRVSASIGLQAAANARRSFHQVPRLRHDYTESGVPNLMSPAGFSIAWSDYMSLAVEKLNALTVGTELEDLDTKTIALMTAREPNQAPIFNWASMAHNNHFFFDGLTPDPTPIPEVLKRELEASFSSMETLRREFVITASSMFGPGFIWLVRAGPADYRILPTYLAGSPYPGAHWRAQATDMNTTGNEGSARSFFYDHLTGQRKRVGDLPPGGIELQPLLCLNTWEHSWLLDWGVGKGGAGGKVAFAEAWWDLIDWELVAKKSGVLRPDFKSGAE